MAAVWWQLGERLATAPVRGAGEGAETSYEHTWSGPPWLTALALGVAAAWVLACYWRERGRSSRATRIGLASLRLFALGLIAWMIYGWARQVHRTDLPDLVVLLDASRSMATIDDARPDDERGASDGAGGAALGSRWDLVRRRLLDGPRPWREVLESRYNVKWYLAGERLRPLGRAGPELDAELRSVDADQPASRLGQAVLDVLQGQRGRPTAAIVAFTDGVTTDGPTIAEAAQQARRRQTPLVLVGAGGEQPPRDLRLTEVRADDVAFVRDVLHFDVQLSSQGYAGRTARLRLRQAGDPTVLAETSVELSGDGAPTTARLSYRPPNEGRFVYEVRADALPGEASPDNNRLEKEVTVTEETVRVLLVQHSPGYEYRYLRTLLDRSLNVGSNAGKRAIELRTLLQQADWEAAASNETSLRLFPVTREELFQYDVVILSDANVGALGAGAVQNLVDFVQVRGGGLIVLAGAEFAGRGWAGGPLAELLPFAPENATAPSPGEILVRGFRASPTPLGAAAPPLQLADTTAGNDRIWKRLPELYWSLTIEEVKPGARVLAERSGGTGATDGAAAPLILLQFFGSGKVLFHASDDFWRWSRDPETEPAYARYWLQWLRYLSRAKLQGGDRGVVIETDREQYDRGEAVRLRVRFVDERAAPDRDDGVALILEREDGGRRNVQLLRDSTDRGRFEATVGQLADGRYRAGLLSPTVDEPPAPARFAIVAPPGEQARLEMDGADLRAAAKKSDGKFYPLAAADGLLDDLPPGRQVRIESLPSEPLWNRWPVAASFIAAVIVEWLLRKRAGML